MLTVKIAGRRELSATDYADASAQYAALRDISNEGGRTWPNGMIFEEGAKKASAYISYNAKVWPGAKYDAKAVPLFDPSAK